ncbi:unnamed protein product [Adineta ricciae]|uniref:Uncharacterized protein n=1 Tax=Adineta ricciae TaxID=249248 RepID=A0A815CI42_ADIRI|nr:unnamed protein product [Adineta ricciae]CAF1284536.1 unnamed protein product [Adineta ricciae]
MKAALALIFFACVAGSMAADARGDFLNQLVQQGQVVAQGVLNQLQGQILGLVQQALGQLSTLVGSLGGRFDIDFSAILNQIKPLLAGAANQVLVQILGSISGLIGGRASINIGEIFNGFLQQITTPLLGIGQQLLNQGLAAVLGGIAGSRGFSDIFASLQQQVSGVVSAAQSALSGALGSLSALGSNILDASKPHWEQLQEQLVGHGLNVLGSISETINNVHGSITGGR